VKALISWVYNNASKRKIVLGQVYKSDTVLKGHSFALSVILSSDAWHADVEALTEEGKKLLIDHAPGKLPLMEGSMVVGELEFYD